MAEDFDGISPMQFGYNDPMSFNDPTGLFGDEVVKTIMLNEVVVRGVGTQVISKSLPQLAVGLGAMSALTRLSEGMMRLANGLQNDTWNTVRVGIEGAITAPSRILNYATYNAINDVIDGGKYIINTPNRAAGETLFDIGQTGTNIAVQIAIARGTGLTSKIISSELNMAKGAWGDFSLAKSLRSSKLDASQLRFSQASVSDMAVRVGRMNSPVYRFMSVVDVVEMPDGLLTTLDNRRVLAASRVGEKIRGVIHKFDDVLPNEMANRFYDKYKIKPKTYGEAINLRISRQKSSWKRQYPNGGNVTSSID